MMPRVMLEAWAAGVPFMASAVGAIGDYVINNQTGFILERTDPDNIKSRVQEVLERPDLRKRVVERASEEVKKFVWPEIAQRYRHLYASIMAQKCNGNG
jgi:glycosyltransferase involved in cell wall biosynthesis